MDEDEVMRRASKAVIEARKAIANAEAALGRTEQFLRERGLSVDQLQNYLQKHGGPAVLQEIQEMAEQTLREARLEADQTIRNAEPSHPAKPVVRRFRQHV